MVFMLSLCGGSVLLELCLVQCSWTPRLQSRDPTCVPLAIMVPEICNSVDLGILVAPIVDATLPSVSTCLEACTAVTKRIS